MFFDLKLPTYKHTSLKPEDAYEVEDSEFKEKSKQRGNNDIVLLTIIPYELFTINPFKLNIKSPVQRNIATQRRSLST